jgi:uncharacterized protein (TIGR03067 family)
MAVILFAVCWLAVSAQTNKKSPALPDEIQGVWSIVSGEEDGKPVRFARGDDVDTGDHVLNEIIIQRDRWIIVDHWGGALVFRARIMTTEPEKCVQIWGDRGQTKREGPREALYRVKGDQLVVCCRVDGKRPQEFTAK